MTITTKFDINDDVWFMKDNKPAHARISGIEILSGERLLGIPDPYIKYYFSQLEMVFPKGCSEKSLHKSKEELLKSL